MNCEEVNQSITRSTLSLSEYSNCPSRLNQQEMKEESGTSIGSSLFSTKDNDQDLDSDQQGEMEDFAEQFKDKVKLIFDHFDRNQDGYLNYEELSSLQHCTSGQSLDSTVYGHLCVALGCKPDTGLSLDGLKLTYASEGTDLDEDYEKVFGKNKSSSNNNSSTTTGGRTKEAKDDYSKREENQEEVYEIGDNGCIDISPDS